MSETNGDRNGAQKNDYCFRTAMEARQRELEAMRRTNPRRVSVSPVNHSLSPLDYLRFHDDPRVFVFSDLVRTTDCANDALVLSQLIYWFTPVPTGHGKQMLPRARAQIDARRWLRKSQKALSYETGLSPAQIKRSIAALRNAGKINTRIETHEGSRIQYIQPTDQFHQSVQDGVLVRGITVCGSTIRISGGPKPGIVLSQLLYWFSADENGNCRARVYWNGEWWVAKTYRELASETGLSSRQVRTAVEGLRQRRLIISARRKFAGRPVLYFRIGADVFSDLWSADIEHQLGSSFHEVR